MAARRSTRNPTGWRSQSGEASDRNTATPMASGVAITKARREETSVPKIAGAAQKWPPPTSQSLEVTMESPSLESAGHAAAKIATAMAITSAGTTRAQMVVTAA